MMVGFFFPNTHTVYEYVNICEPFLKCINYSRVLVGATKDNFTDNPDIPAPGNVYACPVDFNSETECSVLSSLRTSGKVFR